MLNIRSTTHVDALAAVAHHCDHEPDLHRDRPGFASWKIGDPGEDNNLYLCGTSQELRDFAARIVLAANLRDAKTLTRGETLPETVDA